MADDASDTQSDNRLSRLAYAGSLAVASNIVFRMLSTDSFFGNVAILFMATFWLVMPVYGVVLLFLKLFHAKNALRSKAFEWIYYGIAAWGALYFLVPALNAKQFAPLETLIASCEKETKRISHSRWHGSVCWDGWVSSSKGPGTCSHHSGIDYQATRDREERFTWHETVSRYSSAQCQKKARGISWLY